MDIKPTTPGRTPGAGAGRIDKALPGTPARPDEKPVPRPSPLSEKRDDLDISAAARELQGNAGSQAAATSELTPERLREIMGRIASGHYDRPEVRDELVRRLGAVISAPQE
jgi:hypothetical protein